MDNNLHIPTRQRLAFFLLFIGLSFTSLFILSKSAIARSDQVAAASSAGVIEVQPVVTPTYTTLCSSNWYTLSVNALGGQTAYLTRNVPTAAESTNSGEWRPILPSDGLYKVEAFIPGHNSVTWSCPDKFIRGDTTSAHYAIHFDGGQVITTVNQLPISDKWVSLGYYPFKAGSTGYVGLSDVTGEAISTTTVSFSAMRWSYAYVMPIMMKGVSGVNLGSTWTATTGGSITSVFHPGDTVRFYASGTNSNAAGVSARLQMSISGSCGNITSVVDSNITLPAGNWTVNHDAALSSSCPGTYLLTTNLTYQGITTTLYATLISYANTYVLSLPAFDTCTYFTPQQMQTWWNSSPYWSMNLYLGGISAWCPTPVNAAWLSSVSAQGWSFIPTWVGPQAPSACGSYIYPMSLDPTTAYNQGVTEALAAASKATSLGFSSHTVIYYDMESFNLTTACKSAVKSFINGWVYRLHKSGMSAGVYSTSCSAPYWSTIPNVPDDVWIANWYKVNGQYYYDPQASVYGLACLSDSLWSPHKRIRQYTDGHIETWGTLTAKDIDSDIADGLVAGYPTAAAAASFTRNSLTELSAAPAAPLQPQSAQISAFSPLASGQGWALVGSRLFWRSDSQKWSDITPPGAAQAQLLATYFIDLSQGWALLQENASSQLEFLSTHDSGLSWQASGLPIPDGSPVASASLYFINAQQGWVSLKQASGSSFSLGVLLKTSDGGKTWTSNPLPVAGRIYFLDARRGWLAGGPGAGELYQTQDGGASWQPLQLVLDIGVIGQAFSSLPEFNSHTQGSLAVTISDPLEPRVVLYTTRDGGETWQQDGVIGIDPALNPGSAIPAVLFDSSRWLLGGPEKPALYQAQPAGFSGRLPTPGTRQEDLPAGVIELARSGTSTSWALSQSGSCQGAKTLPGQPAPAGAAPFSCTSSSSLWQTTDGGVTWSEITPPSSMVTNP